MSQDNEKIVRAAYQAADRDRLRPEPLQPHRPGPTQCAAGARRPARSRSHLTENLHTAAVRLDDAAREELSQHFPALHRPA